MSVVYRVWQPVVTGFLRWCLKDPRANVEEDLWPFMTQPCQFCHNLLDNSREWNRDSTSSQKEYQGFCGHVLKPIDSSFYTYSQSDLLKLSADDVTFLNKTFNGLLLYQPITKIQRIICKFLKERPLTIVHLFAFQAFFVSAFQYTSLKLPTRQDFWMLIFLHIYTCDSSAWNVFPNYVFEFLSLYSCLFPNSYFIKTLLVHHATITVLLHILTHKRHCISPVLYLR